MYLDCRSTGSFNTPLLHAGTLPKHLWPLNIKIKDTEKRDIGWSQFAGHRHISMQKGERKSREREREREVHPTPTPKPNTNKCLHSCSFINTSEEFIVCRPHAGSWSAHSWQSLSGAWCSWRRQACWPSLPFPSASASPCMLWEQKHHKFSLNYQEND